MGRLPYPLVLGPLGGGERAPLALRRSLPWSGWLKEIVRDLHTWLIRFDPITRRACEQALVVYVTTRDSRDALPKRSHPEIAIEMEIGIAPASPGSRPQRHAGTPLRLLYAGRFLCWKGLHLGLRARHRRAQAATSPRSPCSAKARRRHRGGHSRASSGLDAAVTWLRWVPHARMAELYQAHDALLFPSLHDSSGNAVLEALSQGLPVICFDLGGPGNIVDLTCGRVVATARRSEAECVAGLANAIGELTRDPMLCQELGVGARAQAGQFYWPQPVVRLYDDVRRRLEQRPAPRPAAATAERPSRG